MKISPLGNQIQPVRIGWTLVPRIDEPRSPGLHQSDIANKLMIALGTYDPADFDWDRIQMGLIMEAQIEAGLVAAFVDNKAHKHFRHVVRPGELSITSEVGPIYVTPDGFDVEMNALHEIKATWYSASKPFTEDEFLNYRIQLKTGCLALDTLTAFLHVFYVNGNYKPPRPWPIHSFRFDFDENELTENVAMMSNFVKSRPQLFPEVIL